MSEPKRYRVYLFDPDSEWSTSIVVYARHPDGAACGIRQFLSPNTTLQIAQIVEESDDGDVQAHAARPDDGAARAR